VTNEIIREALAPYDGLHIVTKVGSVRDENGGWPHARSPKQLREQVESNLRTLGIDALDVVNLRVGGGPDGHSPVPARSPSRSGHWPRCGRKA
jgi:aryl-alcohol dehydrogenase-like predicted oxidoreductase